MAALMADNHGVSADDTFLLVTPMFHVNGWGVPVLDGATQAQSSCCPAGTPIRTTSGC